MQNTETIQISSIGIRNSLRKCKPLQSIVDYVWNGFDAKATFVSIDTNINSMVVSHPFQLVTTGIVRDSLSACARVRCPCADRVACPSPAGYTGQ